jgi:hypothetical protein
VNTQVSSVLNPVTLKFSDFPKMLSRKKGSKIKLYKERDYDSGSSSSLSPSSSDFIDPHLQYDSWEYKTLQSKIKSKKSTTSATLQRTDGFYKKPKRKKRPTLPSLSVSLSNIPVSKRSVNNIHLPSLCASDVALKKDISPRQNKLRRDSLELDHYQTFRKKRPVSSRRERSSTTTPFPKHESSQSYRVSRTESKKQRKRKKKKQKDSHQ